MNAQTGTRTGPKNLPPEKKKEKVSVYFLPETLDGLEQLSHDDGITRSQLVETIVRKAVRTRITRALKRVKR